MLKRKLIDLGTQRQATLKQAESAMLAGNEAEYNSLMEQVTNMNAEMDRIQNLIAEQERNVITAAPSAAEARDMAEERASQLRAGNAVTFSAAEVLRALRNSDGDGTLVSGTIVQPTGAGSQVRDGLGETSLLDLVSVQDMTGLGGWEEPYAVADPATAVGAPASTAGTARTAHDPTFAISPIKPYEVAVTSFVDRNISRLSPAAYMAKVQQMAMRALRNKIAALILLGDSEGTHVMYGMVNGTNKASSSIIDTVNATITGGSAVVDEQLLNNLYFAYGNSYEAGANAMLFCKKSDLKAWGALRGTNEKGRLFTITPQPGQANRGVIGDGGMLVPYLLDPNLGAVNGTEQAASSGADKFGCIYGDPKNYLLGLFGDYTIRVDESVKAVERMYTILGDAVVGGNVVVDKGFVVAKIPKAAATV